MGDWFFKFEIDDENGLPFILGDNVFSYNILFQENNENIFKIVVDDAIASRLVNGHEIRVFGDHNNPTPITRQLTATILGINPTGVNTRLIDIEGKDLFRDTVNTTAINNKYADQNTQTTVIDIINKLPGGFTTSLIQNLGISQPYNAVEEYASHLIQRIDSSTFGEIFARPDKKVVYRTQQTEDSGLTITDSMIDNLEEISRGKKTIAESFGVIRVVGGNSTQAFDLNKKVKAVAEIPNAPTNLKNRTMVHIDDRFTTWKGAKELAISLKNTFGKEYFILPTPFRVKDLTAIPRPGAFITVNSTELSLNSSYKVKSVEINSGEGETNAQFLEIKLGDTLQVEINKLTILQAQFESEKRKALDADTITNQKSFSVAIKYAPTVTMSILVRNVVTNPYVWGDGTDETEWGAASWA